MIFKEKKLVNYENRIKHLEENVNKHHETINEMQDLLSQFVQSNQVLAMEYNKTCPLLLDFAPKPNIQMLDLYNSLKFDNIDGGAWKQGWKIEVDERKWNKNNILKVFIVPHSHNDPGWLKTIEEYYESHTKHILNNMLTKLAEDRRRKFIWAEISYFVLWWDELNENSRKKVKRYVDKVTLMACN